jgi:hypothetical protein
MPVELDKGFNYVSLDFSIDGKKEKTLRKYLEQKNKIEARENGTIYLEGGKYKYIIKQNGSTVTIPVILK